MSKHSGLLTFLVFISCIVPISSNADDIFGIYYEEVVPELYREESELTTIPAFIGGSAFAIPATIATGSVGLVGYGIGLPFDLGSDFAQITGALTWYTVGYVPVKAGSFIAGAPFYILEKAFYDVPNALFFGNKSITSAKKHKHIEEEHFTKKIEPQEIQNEPKVRLPRKVVQVEPVDLSELNCPTQIVNGIEQVILAPGMSTMQYNLCNEKIRRITSY